MHLLFLCTHHLFPDAIINDLSAHHVRLTLVNTLEEALHAVSVHRFVAILVDVDLNQLPELPAICRYLKAQPALEQLPLMVITPPYSAIRAAVIEAGADDLLTAPLERHELLLRLEHAKHRHQITRGQSWHGIAEILLHDLKSPSALIISSLELLLEIMDDSAKTYLPFIRNSLAAARRSNFLIEDMIDYILLEQHDLEISCDFMRLPSIIAKMQEVIEPAIADKKMTASYEIPSDLPRVWVDSELMHRVLNALVDNSLKFCIRGDHMSFKAYCEGSYICLEITDSGRPVLPEYESTLFAPTLQTKARRDGSRSSVAMELPFVRAALRSMGGDIRASSEGKRTTFKVMLATQAPDPLPQDS